MIHPRNSIPAEDIRYTYEEGTFGFPDYKRWAVLKTGTLVRISWDF